MAAQLVKRVNSIHGDLMGKKIIKSFNKREIEVLQLITEGMLNKIAQKLCIRKRQ